MVWALHLYVMEVERQLSKTNFYKQQDRDFITENDNTVRRVVKGAISQHKLPESAINLVVDHPHTPKFYLLPKIHKPRNPEIPIVSACNCLTEVIATY